MLTALVLMTAQAIAPAQDAQDPVKEMTPREIILKMLSKYAYAKSLSGKIVQTTSDGGGKVTVNTDFKYVRPNRILIKQDRKGLNGLNQLLVSDGSYFMYDYPTNAKVRPKPGQRLVEPVSDFLPGTRIKYSHDVGYLYNVAHMSLSPTTALDIAIGYAPHRNDLAIHMSTMDTLKAATYKGKTVHKITGDWRFNRSTEKANGKYELLISLEYDFLRLVHTARYNVGSLPAGSNYIDPKSVVTVTTTEEAELKVDAKVDEKVFNFRRIEK